MIIVTGTKRSGTSMWMQILIGAGFTYIGEQFSGRWEQTIKAANPDGFYESHLRRGIYYKTNPHPKTGAYLFPEQVQHHAVKVFIPGLVRSDRAFITKVIATVREWREYESSIRRLYAMEDDNRRKEGKDDLVPLRMPGALEWWAENFALVRDIAIRRYPVHVQSYEGLLAEPQRVVRDVLKWIGKGDAETALAAVKPEHRTQHRPPSDSVEPEIAAVFDEFYAALHAGKGLTAPMLEKLNKTNELVAPRIAQWQRKLADDARRRRTIKAELKGQPPPD
ncbi:hypothetical protein OV079_21175 [Nannocystis pusilla]|uniref:Sulfotransferase domain-containing protein n=1 Tax=Nannocystis pusilla TaxID=889268 RepID=A0A9X3IX29_9BACT|nr:hypothetical protein [Nannocystis pusilla]MCY1008022.1 hypothetical protein [Nannocystis pusilla]